MEYRAIWIEKVSNGYVVDHEAVKTFCKTLAKVNKLVKAIMTAPDVKPITNVDVF